MTADLLSAVLSIEASTSVSPWVRPESFEREMASGNAFVLFNDATQLIGYAIVTSIDNSTLLLKKMAILPSQQEKGYGSILLTQILNIAASRHKTRIVLHVRESNRKACALYRRFGYRVLKKIENYYSKPCGPQDATTALLMEFTIDNESR